MRREEWAEEWGWGSHARLSGGDHWEACHACPSPHPHLLCSIAGPANRVDGNPLCSATPANHSRAACPKRATYYYLLWDSAFPGNYLLQLPIYALVLSTLMIEIAVEAAFPPLLESTNFNGADC